MVASFIRRISFENGDIGKTILGEMRLCSRSMKWFSDRLLNSSASSGAMSSSSASRSPSLIACATRLAKILFSCADIRLLLPDPLAPTAYKHTVHDATRRCPVHLDAIPQSRDSRGGGRSYRLLVGPRKLGQHRN